MYWVSPTSNVICTSKNQQLLNNLCKNTKFVTIDVIIKEINN